MCFLISRLLCDSPLGDVIAQLPFWNDSPDTTFVQKAGLTFFVIQHTLLWGDFKQRFEATGCPSSKLVPYNSPVNEYFQARFKACTRVNATLEFMQQVWITDLATKTTFPKFLGWRLPCTTYSHLNQNIFKFSIGQNVKNPMRLSPPYDHLLSFIRSVETNDKQIHSSFAWLAYRTLLTSDGIDAGGGQPFTGGVVRDLRNSHHVASCVFHAYDAASNIICRRVLSNTQSTSSERERAIDTTHVNKKTSTRPTDAQIVNRAPWLLACCIVHSNIRLLPEFVPNHAFSPSQMSEVTNRTWGVRLFRRWVYYVVHEISSFLRRRCGCPNELSKYIQWVFEIATLMLTSLI